MNNQQQTEDPLRPHTFDGIQEYDKSLPNWWLFTLYITIVFSIGYWIYFHKTSMGPNQAEEYEIALQKHNERVEAAAKQAPALSNESLAVLAGDPATIEAGQQHYMANCSPCHGTELQGPPAPGMPGVSLVDSDWLHGFEPMQIHGIITEGVLAKGMPQWGPVLGATRISQITAFILSKQDPSVTPRIVVADQAVASIPAVPAAPAPTSAPSPTTAPAAETSSAEAAEPATNESLMAMSQDPAIVAAGQQRYATLCVACHGVNLEGPPAPGLPGVSLVDAEWLHGNEPLQIRKTITDGIIEKGMVAWLPVVGEQGANELVAFILSKQ